MKIRVLSYNIHKGFSTSGVDFTLHEMKEALQSLAPDLVLLQEVVGENQLHRKNLKNWPTEAQFEFLADSLWQHFSYGKNAIFPHRHHGNAILSKYPIVFSENIDISTNRLERRGLLHAVIEIPPLSHKKVHIFNVHLDLFEKGRQKQLQRIIDRASSHVPHHEAFILGGDFNDWSQKATPHFYEFLGMHESFVRHHGEAASTFPSFFPMVKLDRLYFRGLEVRLAEALKEKPWSQLSDHLPILAEFDVE